MRTFWLNFHVTYACRHSGACCSSGWPIPVERERVLSIAQITGRQDDQWLIHDPSAPEEMAGTLALQANGHCVFHGAGGCGVYAARPVSCAHFPYVCLIDSRGVHVTLSHYCPTAAAMLFDGNEPIEIVEGPSPVAGLDLPEGLDARESLPPTFAETSTSAKAAADRPVGKPHRATPRLMGWDEYSDWERAEVLKSAESPPMDVTHARFEHARFAVPAPWSWGPAPVDFEQGWRSLVAPQWPHFAPVVQRYRAAKVFASWAAHTDGGLDAVVRVADIADAVLRVEAARQCMAANRRLDAALLEQAIRQSDLLLVHYADGWVLSSATTP